MVTDNTSPGPLVVVVGDPAGPIVSAVQRLAREGEVDVAACDNVYAAVVRIARATGRRVLVVGARRDLAREDNAFLQMATARGIRCCCLLDPADRSAREELLGALRVGVTVLGDVQDIRGLLPEWLGTPPAGDAEHSTRDAGSAGCPARATDGESYEEFRATAAELNALLR